MCFAPQRRALFRHLNFQKWSGHGVFCTFWLRNLLRATTVCNVSSLIWPDGSAPAALASLLFDPPEPQIIGKTQCFATFLPFRALGSSFFWDFLFLIYFDLISSLLFSDSSHLCFSSVRIVGSLTSKLPSMRHSQKQDGFDPGCALVDQHLHTIVSMFCNVRPIQLAHTLRVGFEWNIVFVQLAWLPTFWGWKERRGRHAEERCRISPGIFFLVCSVFRRLHLSCHFPPMLHAICSILELEPFILRVICSILELNLPCCMLFAAFWRWYFLFCMLFAAFGRRNLLFIMLFAAFARRNLSVCVLFVEFGSWNLLCCCICCYVCCCYVCCCAVCCCNVCCCFFVMFVVATFILVMCAVYLSIYLSIYPSIHLSIYPSIYLSIHPSLQINNIYIYIYYIIIYIYYNIKYIIYNIYIFIIYIHMYKSIYVQ